jgi:hypothetical protein
MKFYQFKQNDVVDQLRVVNPSCSFFVNDRTVYYNGASDSSALLGSTINSVPSGFISLYEMNVDRASDNLIYPFVVKGASLNNMSTVSEVSYNAFSYGDIISGSYPLSASITRNFYTGSTRREIVSLKNTLNRRRLYSNHFAYSSSLGDKDTQNIAFVDVPSIFFGSGIKTSTLKLDFYVTGTLTGRLEANAKGELVQTLPQDANSGSVAGVVLGDMGAILITGSWDVTTSAIEDYDQNAGDDKFKWYYYLAGIQGNIEYSANTLPSSSFHLHFESTSEVNTKLMFCTAPRGELNQSENPTFYTKDSHKPIEFTGSVGSFREPVRIIKNITSASYQDPTAPFEKTTYISKIGLYDEDKNLIAIASLARPIKKTESRDITFKLKLDI